MIGLIFKLTLCVRLLLSLQTFTIFIRINAFINVYYNFFDVNHIYAVISLCELKANNSTSSIYYFKMKFLHHTTSDVKRGQNLDAEAEARAMRPRPTPKIIMKKYQIMINNIRFKTIAGKINKIPEFYTIFARKMPDYITKQRDRSQAEAKCLRPRPKFWPQGHFGLDDLTSLL